MAKFGWCLDGFHEGRVLRRAKPCPGHIPGYECSCTCHSHETQDESTATQSPRPTTQATERTALYGHERTEENR